MLWLAFLGFLVVVLSTCTIVMVIRDGMGPQLPPGSHYADPMFGSAVATGGWSPQATDLEPHGLRGRSGPLVSLIDRRETMPAPAG